MEKVTYEIESAGSRVMEIELGAIETQITESEEAILHQFSDATELQMGLLKEMAWFLDNGHTGCSANNHMKYLIVHTDLGERILHR